MYIRCCCCNLTGVNTRTNDVHGCPVVNNDRPHVPVATLLMVALFFLLLHPMGIFLYSIIVSMHFTV